MFNRAVFISAALIAVALGSGCSAGSSTGSAASVEASAKARVQALATSPAVLKAEKQIAPKAVSCAADHGVTLVISDAGTPNMRAEVPHVAGTFMIHPVHSIEDIGTCMGLTPDKVKQLKAFTKQTIETNGIGSGSASKDFTAILNEIAQLS